MAGVTKRKVLGDEVTGLGITLPSAWTRAMNLRPGDSIEVHYDDVLLAIPRPDPKLTGFGGQWRRCDGENPPGGGQGRGRSLPPGHPGREAIMVAADAITAEEFDHLVSVWIRLLRLRAE